MTTSALYLGTLMHARRDRLARRTFTYPVYMAAIDLDELPALARDLRLFSLDARNLFALCARDYEGGLDGFRAALIARGLPRPARTRLVTNLRVLGYTFNPVSFFLNYDVHGTLETVVAEVNNTYGGRHQYVLGPAERIAGPRRVGFRVPRTFFVSPFLHGDMDYVLWFDAAIDPPELAITMHVDRQGTAQRVFVAHLAGTRRVLSDRTLLAAALRYPWMTLQVIALIHLEALKLRWRGVPYRRPGPEHRPLPDEPDFDTRGTPPSERLK